MLASSGSSAPLLGSSGRPARQWKMAGYAVAGTAAVLAMAVVAVTVGQVKTTELAQQYAMPMMAMQPQMMMAAAPQQGAQPVYYMPVAAPQQGLAAAQAAQPVVYYYVPQAAASPVIMLNGTGGGGGGNKTKEEKSDFVCTVDNIKALSAKVQAKWDKCKGHKDYEEPNKDAGASRRLLEWVWEPESGVQKTARPRHGPSHYQLRLNEASRAYNTINHMSMLANETGGAEGKNETEDEDDGFVACLASATADACKDLSGCDDPVCANYYNEPEVESICGMCTMSAGSQGMFGCFSEKSEVVVESQGKATIDSIKVGDRVLASSADGSLSFSRVYFIHDHEDVSQTVKIAHSKDVMELTPHHIVPVFSQECGNSYCAAAKQVMAKDIVKGDRIYVATADGSMAQEVVATSRGSSQVRYLLTEDNTVVVNGVVGSVLSTGAGALETLPFRLIDMVKPGALQYAPVAAALKIIMESPILRSIEAVVNTLAFPSLKAIATPRAFATTSGTY